MDIRLPLNRWTLTGLAITIVPLIAWEWWSLIGLALFANVWAWVCWVPAVATSGVMLSSTALHMTPALDRHIRRYAGYLAAAGITGGFLGSAAHLYIEAAHTAPSAWIALPVGGIPVFMGGLLVHLLSMVFTQRRREQVRAEAAAQAERDQRIEQAAAETARLKRIGEENADHERKLSRQRALTMEAQRTAEATTRQAAEAERLRQLTAERAEVARAALREKPHLVVDNTRKKPTSPVSERAQAWLAEQHRAGIPLDKDDSRVGPAAIAKATGINSETCRKSHKRWKAAVAEELQLIADLTEAAG